MPIRKFNITVLVYSHGLAINFNVMRSFNPFVTSINYIKTNSLAS